MSRPDEVDFTVKFLKERNVQFALLHCNSTYPAAFEDINLRYMDQLRKYDVPVVIQDTSVALPFPWSRQLWGEYP